METKFKKGDKVTMHSCYEVRLYRNRTWTCETDSFIDKSGDEVVFLKKFSGAFMCKYLKTK